ncbi:hypothetical protein VPH35_103555 [Triticum aestivum]
MHPPAKLLLLLAVLLATSPHALAERPPAVAACTPQERAALLAFKQGISISSDAAGLLASWCEDDCCRWRGIRCSNRTGHVVALNLRGQGLAGEISPSLLSLPHLEHLHLHSKRLVGPAGSIPEFLGSMGNLRYLNLSGAPHFGEASFSGQVPPPPPPPPPPLGNLSKLQHLDLSSNKKVSSNDLSWLTRLPFLRFLSPNFVDLSMAADWDHAVNTLRLRSLHLEGFSLTSANQSLPHSNLITTLEVLDLAVNKFDQPVASCWFWNLRLKRLYLEGNNGALYGPLPDALEGMVRLQELSFSESGSHMMSMGSTDLKNLCNLRFLYLDNKLQELHLLGNQLTGTLADWMGHRTSLVILDLDAKNITGPIPEFIGRFTYLRVLDLWNNLLTGHVPPEIGTLTNLASLDLGLNHLDGLITEGHFHGLKSLEKIDLSDNQLEIMMGPLFPAWLKWQVDLTYLDISSTGITDRFPDWFSSSFSKITYMDIPNNQITGSLPKNMGNMSLGILYCPSNNISGRIPRLPRNLDTLDISRNSLSRPLPSDFGAPELSAISLFSNYIIGQIPLFVCELYVYSLGFSNNLLQGELPQCFSTRDKAFLLLSNNRLSGKFPPFLKNCTMLSFLDLARNRFSRTLPMWIGNLGELQFLWLSNNMFHGHILNNITNLRKIYHLNLAANGISGSIPHHLSNLTMMTTPYVHVPGTVVADFQIMVGIVFKRQELQYRGVGVLEILSIDFSCNYLTGKIPEEITSLGGLIKLNLSWNQLNGGFPKKIGNMQTLESLDFSDNDISGEIPSSLPNLTYLTILDLSYNHLAGIIPSGVQLDTLYTENPFIYNGNPGLCGPILHRSCSVNKNAAQRDHQQRSKKNSESTLSE